MFFDYFRFYINSEWTFKICQEIRKLYIVCIQTLQTSLYEQQLIILGGEEL